MCVYVQEQEQDRSMPHQEVCGHKFVRQPRQTRVLRGLTCLACRKKVRGLIREWYRCRSESGGGGGLEM